jgi:VCBS repeat-containing protein
VGARIAYHIADSLTDAPFRLGGFDSFSLGGTDARADGAVTIPDAHLLFNAEFKKLGYDLLLVGDDGKTFIVHDYFKSDERATLMAPSGASLAGRLVSLLAGAEQHVQEAQAGAAAATSPIGRVEKVSGTCTIIRNGVAIAASQGDVVLKGDVLQTAQGSSLGVAFLDGTAFFLSASARMAVTDLVYTPNGTNNSAFMSIVQGTVTFVAGQVAKTGDMKVDTPVATMGIRGTAVFVQIGANDGTGKFAVLTERGGETGTFQLFDKAGNFIGNVSSSSLATQISGAGIGQIQILQVPLTPAEQQIAQGLLNQVYDVIQSFQQGPQLTPREGNAPGSGSSGSSSPNDQDLFKNPIPEVNPPQLPQANNTGPSTNNANVEQTSVVVTDASFERSAVEGGTLVTGTVGGGGIITFRAVDPLPPGLTFNPDGTFSFDPTVSAYDHLAQAEVQQIAFHYEGLNNGGAVVVRGVLNLIVTGTNDTPVAFTIVDTVAEGTVTTQGQLLAHDVDDHATLTFSVVGELPPGLVVHSNGTFSFDATNPAYDHLAVGEQEVFHFTYQVTDEFGAVSEPAEATITVTGTNDAPVITGGTTTGSFTPGGQQGGGGGEGGGAVVAAAAAAAGPVGGNALVNGLGGSAGFGEQSLAANDDGSTGAIDITSVFGAQGLNFFGHYYTSIYINNNGNITFNSPTGQFTPSQITAGAGNPIIAPFWADVDTRGSHANTPTPGGNSTGSNLVYWDFDTVNGVFTVTWDDVGFYSGHTNHLNAFQLQLINRGNGDFDIVFRYEDINWTTGQASGGDNDGLGGSIARAGYSAGDGLHYFELPQSGNQAGMLALEATTGNTGTTGVDEFQVRNGTVVTNPTTSGVIDFNDPDFSDTHTAIAVFAGEGNPLGSLTVQILHDTAGTGTGGQVAWDYSIDPDLLAGLGANDTLIETFNVIISDGHGGTATQPVTITLHGVNDDPTIGGTSAGSVAEDETLVATGQLSVTDPDPTDAHTWSVLGANSSAYGTFSVDQSGLWAYSLDNNAAQSLASGQVVHETYTVQVDDGHGGIDTQVVNITINGDNDPPAITGVVSGAVTEDTTLTATGQLTAADADLADTQTWSVLGADSSAYGSFNVDQSGLWTYSLDNNAAQSLASGQVVHETYTVQVDDGHGGIDTQVINITINGDNDPPAITGVVAGAVTEDTTLTATGQLTAADADPTDTQTWSVVGANSSAYGSFNIDQSGLWTYSLDNNAAQSLASGQVVHETYTVEVNDGHGGIDTQVINITINGDNDPPAITGVVAGAVTEDTTLTATGQLAVADADLADTQTWSVLGANSSAYGSFSVDQSGLWTYSLDNNAAQSLVSGQVVHETYTVQVNDGHGGIDTQVVNITINGSNDLATITGTATATVTEDATLLASGDLNVADADTGQAQFQAPTPASLNGTYGNFTFDAATGQWTYTLNNGAPNVQALVGGQQVHDYLTVKSLDGTDTETIDVTVVGADDAPSNHVPGGQHVNEDTTLAFNGAKTISISSPQGNAAFETVTLSVQNGTLRLASTAGLIVSGNETGIVILGGTVAEINAALAGLTYQPYQNFNGSDTLQIKTTDNIGTDIDTVAITVDSINDAPIVFAPSQMNYWTSNPGESDNVTPIDNIIFADPDSGSDSVTVTLALGPQSGVLNAQDLANDGVTVTSSQSGSTLTLTGSIAAINAYIAGDNIFFDPPGQSLADRILTISIDDGGHNGGGGNRTATTTSILHSVSFTTTNGNDNIDLHNVNLDSIPTIDLKSDISGNTLVTSSSNNPQGAPIHYEANDTGGFDTVTMVFTPDQLSEILSNSVSRSELQSYLDGDPGSGVSADTLDLSNTSWHAIVDGAEVAKVALKAGDDFVVDDAITNDLPDFRSNQLGTANNDTLVATAAVPNLIGVNGGGNGHDILVATTGGSQLDGGAGNDLLLGRSGADRLFGGSGSDIMAGGKGSDTFAFTAATTGASDHDVITDFQHGEDVIEVDTAMFANFSVLLSNAHASADGQDTIIRLGTYDITLKNTAISVLSPQDFHFV